MKFNQAMMLQESKTNPEFDSLKQFIENSETLTEENVLLFLEAKQVQLEEGLKDYLKYTLGYAATGATLGGLGGAGLGAVVGGGIGAVLGGTGAGLFGMFTGAKKGELEYFKNEIRKVTPSKEAKTLLKGDKLAHKEFFKMLQKTGNSRFAKITSNDKMQIERLSTMMYFYKIGKIKHNSSEGKEIEQFVTYAIDDMGDRANFFTQ